MSDASEPSDRSLEEDREALASTFDVSSDPLAEHAEQFASTDVDPFEMFYGAVLDKEDPAPATRRKYHRVVAQWRAVLEEAGRHPACPATEHVETFVEHLREDRNNQPGTIKTKLRRLDRMFEYWQASPVFPHGKEYNPFTLVLSRFDFRRQSPKDPPHISVQKLARILSDVTHVRNRAIILLQLKLGLRGSEVTNLRLEDIALDVPELKTYIELGRHEQVVDRSDALYVATRYERDKNKSRVPRALPIDDELQRALTDYLLVRPDTGASRVFLATTTHQPIGRETVNRVWKDVFHPEYAETEKHRAVTSHYGRHRFTTHWRVTVDLNRELVKYMRGDHPRDTPLTPTDAMEEYVHTYYEDIEDVYRRRIYKFRL